MALNAPIQGTAADIVKMAMLKVDTALREADLKSRMLLQVHDEIVLEIAPGERETTEKLVRQAMADAVHLRAPLDVSVGVGADWESAAHQPPAVGRRGVGGWGELSGGAGRFGWGGVAEGWLRVPKEGSDDWARLRPSGRSPGCSPGVFGRACVTWPGHVLGRWASASAMGGRTSAVGGRTGRGGSRAAIRRAVVRGVTGGRRSRSALDSIRSR